MTPSIIPPFSRSLLRLLLFMAIYAATEGCVEPYEFVIEDTSPGVVIEAFISDKSYYETLQYPSDGRRFRVRLTYTGDVINTRPIPVRSAVIELLSGDGQSFSYSPVEAGIYVLDDSSFRALRGVPYKLRISLGNDQVFESSWETMPDATVPAMGPIGFDEREKEVFVMEANEWKVRTRQFATATIDVPENQLNEAIYYRWTFLPTWIYHAPILPPTDPLAICWAQDGNYLNGFSLQRDVAGGYKKDLFEIATVRNPRIYDRFSTLVTQHVMTRDYYDFWKEMQDQNENSSLQDTPPFNLKTNFVCVTGDTKVVGYFGVVQEQARRWYFSKDDLSYYVENTSLADCLALEDLAPECDNCLAYSFGQVTNVKPVWWE